MEKLKLSKQFQKRCQKTRLVRQLQYLTLVLLFVTTNLFSKSYSQTSLTLNFKNTEVEKIISFIEGRTDYRFLYQTSEIDLKRRVDINYKGKVSKAVEMLFTGTSVYPVVANKQIILKKRKIVAQQLTISGVVSDTHGIPLPGVDVIVNKIERFTITDGDGRYKILVKKGDKISFTLLGFKRYEITVGNQEIINVTLEEDVNIIEELVLIGYGKEKKGNIATAVSSVRGETIGVNMQAGPTFDRGIEGLVKGVFVTQGTGELGKNADIIIRGVTSPFGLSNNNPLYIIDGVAVTPPTQFAIQSGEGFNPLEAVNPEDIESVEVLKDAAATSIYGSRGANGVIIVKTKSGVYDQPTLVKVSTNSTFGRPIKTLDYLNAADFKKHILALNENSYKHYLSGADPEYAQTLESLPHFGFSINFDTGELTYDPSKVKFGTADTDWNKEVYRKVAMTNRYNARITGGGESFFYGLSLGFTNQEGVLGADEKKQHNARLNMQVNVFDNFKVGASVNYVRSNQNTGYNNTSVFSGFNFLGSVLRYRPDVPVYDQNGNFTFTTQGDKITQIKIANPVAMTKLGSQRELINNSILSNIFAEYTIFKGLMFKVEYSFGAYFSDSNDFKPKQYDLNGYNEFSNTQLFIDNVKSTSSVVNYTLNYNKSLNDHNLTALLGYSYTKDVLKSQRSIYQDFVSNLRSPQFAKTTLLKDKRSSPSGLSSAFTRLGYNYKNKYGVSGVLRWDRSSKYAYENRSVFFPSISANWNIHKEDFLQNGFFEELRIRASYGHTGSSIGENFAYLQTFNVLGEGTKYNGEIAVAYGQNFANKRLQWEKTREYNLGFDFGAKRGIITGSLDLYHKKTTGAVSDDRVVSETGADQFQRNNASLLNKGIEVELGSTIIDTERFRWSVNLNASKNINKLLAVSDVILSGDNFSYYSIGREVNLIKGYVVNGIIKKQSRIDELNANAVAKGHSYYDQKGTGVGDYEYKDTNNDGKVDSKDRVIIGSRQPDLFGGFNTRVKYRDFNLSAYFSYAFGLESLRGSEFFNNGKFINVERYLSAENRWSSTNTSATLPRLIHRTSEDRISTVNVFDASYVRLTSLRLGYNLPFDFIEKIRLSKLNFYIAGTNLATWTKFPGIDPQGVSGGASVENRNNEDAYPSAKTFSLGVSVEF